MTFIPIREYRDFWDIPRIFLVRNTDSILFLFDCKFDQEKEDYQDTFHIYKMPEIRDSELSGPWADLSKRASQFIGVVKISEVTFDKTHRQFVDDEIISEAAKI